MTKRKRTKDNDQPNLKRLRSEITGLAKTEQRFQSLGRRTKSQQSRKDRRKEERHLKKLRKLAYSQRKPIPTKDELDRERKTKEVEKKKEEKLKQKKAAKKEKQKRLNRKEKMLEEEKRREKEMANLYDDKVIREMEKKLKLNKRKKDTLPKSFMDDGLDYILDVVSGSDKLKDIAMETGDEDSDTEGDRLALYGITGDLSDDDDNDDNKNDDDDHDDDGDDNDNSGSDDQEADSETDDDKNDDSNQIQDSAVKVVKSIPEKPKAAKTKKKVTFKDDETVDLPKLKVERKIKHKAEQEKETKRLKRDNIFQEANDDSDDSLSDDQDAEIDSDSNENAHDIDDDSNENLSDYGNDSNNDFDNSDDDESYDSENNESKENKNAMEKPDFVTENLKEDIYGRLRDEEGNIVKPSTGAYVPPARRLMMADADEKKKIQLERLKKQLKGLVNRASESNIQPISSQIENLYLTNSRADLNETLISLMFELCVTSVLTPERLAMELMMLVAILHGNVGSEVGAVFLQHLVQKFDELCQLKDYGIGKEMDNVIVLLSHLYNFKVVHSVLIFGIVKRLVSSFKERDVELILLLLKNVGFSLRKDDPSGLKSLIQEIQSKASSQEGAALTDQSRVRFMLDVIMAIRNNNMRKIPNYDPDHLEHLRKLIRNYIRGGHFGDNQLHITLEDLLKADEQGKWWVVGSAWSGQGPRQQLESSKGQSSLISGIEVSTKLQELARKQRMNTDLRRNIFFIIMTSEDYIDAFEKLLRLGLKSNQQQEIVLVILDCCLHEKKYNPFYSYLGQKFCEHHRSFQQFTDCAGEKLVVVETPMEKQANGSFETMMAFQFSIWDRFKELGQISDANRQNLGKLLTHLFATKALSLSVFKVVTFGTLEKPMVRLLKQVLSDLLLEYPQSTTEAVFQRIAQLDKLKVLHEGLRLFLHHFILGKRKGDSDIATLKERVEIVDKIFSAGKSHMLL